MDLTQYIEILEWAAVITGLLFIVLMIMENIWSWFFGIISSVLLVYVMYQNQLYSESLLYVIYALLGVYGWYMWSDKRKNSTSISAASWKTHAIIVSVGAILTIALGSIMKSLMPDSFNPFGDAFSSVFGLIASYMEAQKWLSSWVFWIIINAFSIWLYMSRELNITSLLMIVYFVLSIVGLYSWRKKYYATINL